MSRRSRKRTRRRKDAPTKAQVHYPWRDSGPIAWFIGPDSGGCGEPIPEQERVHVTKDGKGLVAKAIERSKGKR